MRKTTSMLAALAIIASACSGSDGDSSSSLPDDGDRPVRSGSTEPLSRIARRLAPFDDCDALLDYFQAEARNRVGAYGLDAYGGWIDQPQFFEDDMAVADGPLATDAPSDAAFGQDEPADEPAEFGGPVPAIGDSEDFSTDDGALGGDAGGEFTPTNVQELGVDEPDIIKTDGERIVLISDNTLSLALLDGEPRITDDIVLPEGWGHELFLSGDRAIVLTNAGDWGRPMPVEPAGLDTSDEPVNGAGAPAALLIEIDMSDPTDLTIAASMRIEGRYLSARTIGDRLRMAVRTGPEQLPWLYPSGPASEQRALEANQATIDDSTLEDWLPTYRLTTSDTADTGTLASCDRTSRPAEFAGFNVISVVDLDLSDGLSGGFDPDDAVGVVASGETVYSSSDRLYIATTTWTPPELATREEFDEWNETYFTDVHSFAIAPGEPTEYVGSGAVEGTLLNQFSLDEHDGYVRVITTSGSPWGGDDSETQLVAMDESGDELVEVGKVGGLGKGEQLYSARILDDVGFAVTFRQIDPFYVIDLSDPTNPRVTGELKIPGFSTYLHPIGDDRVLGLGQGEDGGFSGTKLSLFDVSDRSNPREIAKHVIPNTSSPAEYDHRAFQMIGTTAILPIQSWGGSFNGALLFDIGDDSITEIGRITHDSERPSTSDCRPLTLDDVPEESEFFWMLASGYQTVSVCDAGGTVPEQNAGQYCDYIRGVDAESWFYDFESAGEHLARLDIQPDDQIEVCYLESDWRQQVQRSLVVDGTIWTMSQLNLQGNDLETLEVVHQLLLPQ